MHENMHKISAILRTKPTIVVCVFLIFKSACMAISNFPRKMSLECTAATMQQLWPKLGSTDNRPRTARLRHVAPAVVLNRIHFHAAAAAFLQGAEGTRSTRRCSVLFWRHCYLRRSTRRTQGGSLKKLQQLCALKEKKILKKKNNHLSRKNFKTFQFLSLKNDTLLYPLTRSRHRNACGLFAFPALPPPTACFPTAPRSALLIFAASRVSKINSMEAQQQGSWGPRSEASTGAWAAGLAGHGPATCTAPQPGQHALTAVPYRFPIVR